MFMQTAYVLVMIMTMPNGIDTWRYTVSDVLPLDACEKLKRQNYSDPNLRPGRQDFECKLMQYANPRPFRMTGG